MRAKEFITEKTEKLRADTVAAIPSMRKHSHLDNSSPYDPWRFSIALAGMPHNPMSHSGPSGQKLVTIAYTQGDADIIAATEKHMGATGEDMSTPGSKETDDVGKMSPVANWMKPTKEKKKK
jgi:hypothetical protein